MLVFGLPLVLFLLPLVSATALPIHDISLKPRAIPPLSRDLPPAPSLVPRDEPARLQKRADYQTEAPPGTRWQAFPYYQWDDQHKDWVTHAWAGAKALAEAAAASIDAVAPGSPAYQLFFEGNGPCKETKRGTAEFKNCYRMFIAANNLAYGQLFGADPENIGLIQTNFRKLLDSVEDQGADGHDNLPLLLTVSAQVTDKDSKENICDGGTQAFVIGFSQIQEYIDAGGVQPDERSWVLNLCPAFFEMKRMEQELDKLQKDKNGKRNEVCNLDNLDTTSRVMLHEMTHFAWTLNTNNNNRPSDQRGYRTVTSYGTDDANVGANQRMHTKSFSSQNADNYAWMGVYQYFNSLAECQGVEYSGPYAQDEGNGCTDVWPSSPGKWVKMRWNNYPSGNN
ncbi:MAG: hypothetical protein M1817_002205 [Caeruleum heppii]|nr:MAG: hypothetical protein M1817_002205 [Caeruleum heppii]